MRHYAFSYNKFLLLWHPFIRNFASFLLLIYPNVGNKRNAPVGIHVWWAKPSPVFDRCPWFKPCRVLLPVSGHSRPKADLRHGKHNTWWLAKWSPLFYLRFSRYGPLVAPGVTFTMRFPAAGFRCVDMSRRLVSRLSETGQTIRGSCQRHVYSRLV